MSGIPYASISVLYSTTLESTARSAINEHYWCMKAAKKQYTVYTPF